VYNYHDSCASVTSGLESSFDKMVWLGMGWFWSSLCETVWSIEPLLDHTLRLIQHNWVVLAYNFNVVIWVLIIGEVRYRCISTYLSITVLSLVLSCIIILFLHLLSTNYKCTQRCYFFLLLKPAAQNERMDWNSSMSSSRMRVTPVVILMMLWSLPLFRSAESHHSL
jgi:hypothetical protein